MMEMTMARYELTARDSNNNRAVLTFFVADNGGHVYLETGANHGTTGQQICRGGAFRGFTVTSTPDRLADTARAWWAAHRAAARADRIELCV